MIKQLIAVAALAAAAATPALAARASPAGDSGSAARTPSEGQSRQQNRMASCNHDAVGKKGDERKAFMKQCLSSAGGAKAVASARAAKTGRRDTSQ